MVKQLFDKACCEAKLARGKAKSIEARTCRGKIIMCFEPGTWYL